MQIKRFLLTAIPRELQEGKVVLLYGPRRVGKTTLISEWLASRSKEEQAATLVLNGENRIVQETLSSQSIERLQSAVGAHRLLVVDEAQHIPHVGLNLKLIVDHIPGIRVLASGSASFALAQEVGEPLTGRKKMLHLYPIWTKELVETRDELYARETLEPQLIFSLYPELFQLASDSDRIAYLHELVDSSLFKDLLALEDVRHPKKLRDLLTLLAFQIGREVSLAELAGSLEVGKQTVFRYLDLLEQSFILVNVRGFSRNLRKEVTKTSRYYFYDNGVRNALVNNFNALTRRDDVGLLWENHLFMERLKKLAYERRFVNTYFWRTYDQQEIDHVEEAGGTLSGYECVWSGRVKKKPPRAWLAAYPGASYEVVTRERYLPFIT